tara:strand:+ start:137 stop:385 length:249 start_codon:yes stop_codon:yes gene_type:complete
MSTKKENSIIKNMLMSKKGIAGVIKDAKAQLKKKRDLQAIEEWIDFENSTQPTTKKFKGGKLGINNSGQKIVQKLYSKGEKV